VTAVAEEEWKQVDARKARIAAQSERIATRAAELIAEKLERGNVPLNVLVPVSVVIIRVVPRGMLFSLRRRRLIGPRSRQLH
jgi:hypothetical protein